VPLVTIGAKLAAERIGRDLGSTSSSFAAASSPRATGVS
jgi:hypothetical protein